MQGHTIHYFVIFLLYKTLIFYDLFHLYSFCCKILNLQPVLPFKNGIRLNILKTGFRQLKKNKVLRNAMVKAFLSTFL